MIEVTKQKLKNYQTFKVESLMNVLTFMISNLEGFEHEYVINEQNLEIRKKGFLKPIFRARLELNGTLVATYYDEEKKQFEPNYICQFNYVLSYIEQVITYRIVNRLDDIGETELMYVLRENENILKLQNEFSKLINKR